MKETLRISRKKYVVNGKTYRSIEEMPPNIQKIFKDTDRDGIPDIIEDIRDKDSSVSIEINGKKYKSWDEVPQEFQKYRKLRDDVSRTNETKQVNALRSGNSTVLSSLLVKILIIAAFFIILLVLYRSFIS